LESHGIARFLSELKEGRLGNSCNGARLASDDTAVVVEAADRDDDPADRDEVDATEGLGSTFCSPPIAARIAFLLLSAAVSKGSWTGGGDVARGFGGAIRPLRATLNMSAQRPQVSGGRRADEASIDLPRWTLRPYSRLTTTLPSTVLRFLILIPPFPLEAVDPG
jgi:hypothetical protein